MKALWMSYYTPELGVLRDIYVRNIYMVSYDDTAAAVRVI